MTTLITSAPLLLTALLLASPQRELAGVKMPDTVQVEGKTLSLNGMGLRKKFVFKVYVAGLYLETPTHDAQKAIVSDETKRVDMVMLRNLEKEKVIEAIRTGFQKNAADRLPALQERLDKLVATIPDLKQGQTLTVSYVPGRGTRLEAEGGAGAGGQVSVEGKDFAEAMFSVWLGSHPVDGDLKNGMLGR
jgi:hypothetical protein